MKQTANSARTNGKTKSRAKAEPTSSTTRRRATAAKPAAKPARSAAVAAADPAIAKQIDQQIRDVGGWRGATLARMRALILEAAPDAIEELKWRGTPVWSQHGILCTGETYKQVVKLTFARGASVPDPQRLFNASLDGNVRRAIDIREGETVDAKAFKALVKAAVAQNAAAKSKPAKNTAAAPSSKRKSDDVVLLSGGNPQIPKGDGDAPVQAYLDAIPGWKRDVARRIDALVVRTVPGVVKAVKWNSPFYGVAGQGWFLSFHMFSHYVKVTFFRGTSLDPPPPGPSKDANVRYADVREGELDEAQMARWVKQAAALPGWMA